MAITRMAAKASMPEARKPIHGIAAVAASMATTSATRRGTEPAAGGSDWLCRPISHCTIRMRENAIRAAATVRGKT